MIISNIFPEIFVIENVVWNTGEIFSSVSLSTVVFFSVIHPEEYEGRLIRFLFEKVFLDCNDESLIEKTSF